jgi:hypothetical protein
VSAQFVYLTRNNRRKNISYQFGDLHFDASPAKLFRRGIPENCRMSRRNFFGGPPIGKIVQRQRLSGRSLGALQGVRVSMIGEIGRAKHRDPIK